MDNELNTKVKERLIQVMKQRNINIYRLSVLSEISDASIRNWFNKRNCNPSIESINKICEVLDIPLYQFFIFDDEQKFKENEINDLVQSFILLSQEKKDVLLNLIKCLKD